MRMRVAMLAAVLGAAAAAFGQVQTAEVGVTYSLSWVEAHPIGGNWAIGVLGNGGSVPGTVEQGEGVLFTIKMTMSLPGGGSATAAGGGTGTPLHWAPTVFAGSSGTGTLSGFWSGDLNLGSNAGAASGQWGDGSTNYANALRRKLVTFTTGGGAGNLAGGNNLSDIQPAQFGGDADSLNHGNTVTCWQGLWIPDFVTVSATQFSLQIGSLGLLSSVAARDDLYGNGFDFPVPLKVAAAFGSAVSIPLAVPAPHAAGLAALGVLIAARRRRQ